MNTPELNHGLDSAGTRAGPFFWQRRCREASLLIFKKNEGAVKLNERNDFKVMDRATVVPHELIRYTREVLLTTAPV